VRLSIRSRCWPPGGFAGTARDTIDGGADRDGDGQEHDQRQDVLVAVNGETVDRWGEVEVAQQRPQKRGAQGLPEAADQGHQNDEGEVEQDVAGQGQLPAQLDQQHGQHYQPDQDEDRQTLTKILEDEVTASEPAVISEPYQQILAVFTPDRGALRAKDVCLALSIGTEPKDTEGIRAKPKRLVNRQILTEAQPGLFTLTEKPA
jgi:hypothetical protein